MVVAAAPIPPMPFIDPVIPLIPLMPALDAVVGFLRLAKREIVQQDDDLLLVGAAALGVMDDERRRHQLLLLEFLMRVHPVRAAEAKREVIAGRGAGCDRWRRDIRDT